MLRQGIFVSASQGGRGGHTPSGVSPRGRSGSAGSAGGNDDNEFTPTALHVLLEYRICRVAQFVLSALRSRHITKPRWQLEIGPDALVGGGDGVAVAASSPAEWRPAVTWFPIVSGASAGGGTGGGGGKGRGGCSVQTLLELLSYLQYRIHAPAAAAPHALLTPHTDTRPQKHWCARARVLCIAARRSTLARASLLPPPQARLAGLRGARPPPARTLPRSSPAVPVAAPACACPRGARATR